ncbi:MAG: Bax inhibitor-1/YccA family protein [Gemmataceae bacterium]
MATTDIRKTSNPAFSAGMMKSLSRQPHTEGIPIALDTVSIGGAAAKSAILLFLLMATAVGVVAYFLPTVAATRTIPVELIACLVIGSLGGFAMAMYTIFVPTHSPYTAPVYAVLKGLSLGGISAAAEYAYPGIAFQAMGITFGALLGILALYGTGIIRVNDTFRAVIFGAMFAILFVYLFTLVFGMFGVRVPFMHDLMGNGAMGIGFSVVVCIIAALNFAIDFQNIVDAKAAGAPKWFEWYLGFGLLLTIVWLYLEVLRLLMKMRSND